MSFGNNTPQASYQQLPDGGDEEAFAVRAFKPAASGGAAGELIDDDAGPSSNTGGEFAGGDDRKASIYETLLPPEGNSTMQSQMIASKSSIPMPSAFTGMPPAFDDELVDEDAEANFDKGKLGSSSGFLEDNLLGTSRFFYPPKYTDKWAAILFYSHILLYVIIAFSTDTSDASPSKRLVIVNGHSIKIVGIVSVLALVFAYSWLAVVQKYAQYMIWGSNIATIVLYTLGALLLFGQSSWFGLLYVAFACLHLLWLVLVRHRIRFATLVLETVSQIIKQNPHMLTFALIGLGMQFAYTVFFLWVLEACFSHASGFWSLLLLVTYFWTLHIISNVIHVTVSGIVGAYYFAEHDLPANYSQRAFVRAITTSFGSICLGSLLTAILHGCKVFLRGIRKRLQGSQSAGAAVFLYIIEYCLLWVEKLIQYFNLYAFVHVALYGKDYRTAGRDAWELMKDRGVLAIVNDELISSVLWVGTLIFSAVLGLIGGMWGHSYDLHQGFYVAIGFACFLISWTIFSSVMGIVTSCVIALFVCFAEEPDHLRLTHPVLYDKLCQTYALRMPSDAVDGMV